MTEELQNNASLNIYRASAGSGKTFTLAVEYITLLAVNPMEYQNILAVTFTNKATAEMKQRILNTLYGIAHGLKSADVYVEKIMENILNRRELPVWKEEPYKSELQNFTISKLKQRAKESLCNIIHDYSRFHVETIDSFFQGIVRELANELELSMNIKVELEEKDVLSEAVDQIIENLSEESREFRTIIQFIDDKIRENLSWQVNDTVKDFGQNIFKEKYLIHGEEVRKTITDFEQIDRYRKALYAFLETRKKDVLVAGREFAQKVKETEATEKDFPKAIFTFADVMENDEIKEPKGSIQGTFSKSVREFTENEEKWFKKTSKNKDGLLPTVSGELMPMLQRCFEVHDEYLGHIASVNAITQHLYSLMLLNEISKTVKKLNEDSSRFLLSETANFLRNVINNQDIPFIYEKTGVAIKHIMIDEFQDTSSLQWGNFRPLIMNGLALGGTGLIVGDVKQSIYRFRNSDWQILNNIEKDEELREHMGNIPAHFNFRSSRHVVDFNNRFFANAVEVLKQDCPALETAYQDVVQVAKKEADAGYVKIENIDYHSETAEDEDASIQATTNDTCDSGTACSISDNYDEAILQRIQQSVKDLIENGVNPNDITILIRTNKEVQTISDYLESHQDVLKVKVVSDDAFRLDASPAVNLIIYALRLLAYPTDKLHLATFAYYYQRTFAETKEVENLDALNSSIIESIDVEHIDTLLPSSFCQQERKDLMLKSLTEQVEYIYQNLELHLIPDQDAYMFFFMDLLASFSEEKQGGLDAFLQAWDEKLCEKTIPGGSADGVRIMTMHKSKGLEFHSVIIPSCSWSIKPKGSEVMWCKPEGAPYDGMPLLPISVNKAKDESIFVADRQEEELRTLVDNINVLYVAFTRAKNNLIVLTGKKKEEKKEDERETKVKVENTQELLIQSMPDVMNEKDIEGIITCYEYGSIASSEKKESEKERNVMECDYEPLSTQFISHPSVAEFRQSYDSDLFFTQLSDQPLVQLHADRIRSISLGNLYHHIFQMIRTSKNIPHVIRVLDSRGCFGTLIEADEAQKTVTRLVEGVEKYYPEWFSEDWRAINERAILFEKNQTMSIKRPDRVVAKENHVIIIDYKTAQGVARKKEDGTYQVPHENLSQVEEYKELLMQMGYEDVKAYLWYIFDEIVVPVHE